MWFLFRKLMTEPGGVCVPRPPLRSQTHENFCLSMHHAELVENRTICIQAAFEPAAAVAAAFNSQHSILSPSSSLSQIFCLCQTMALAVCEWKKRKKEGRKEQIHFQFVLHPANQPLDSTCVRIFPFCRRSPHNESVEWRFVKDKDGICGKTGRGGRCWVEESGSLPGRG